MIKHGLSNQEVPDFNDTLDSDLIKLFNAKDSKAISGEFTLKGGMPSHSYLKLNFDFEVKLEKNNRWWEKID